MKKNIRVMSLLAPLALATATSSWATCNENVPSMVAACSDYGPLQVYTMAPTFDGKTKAELLQSAQMAYTLGFIQNPVDPADVAFIPDDVPLHSIAYIDAEYSEAKKCALNDEACELKISKDVEVQSVYVARTWTPNVFSTMTLPFALNTGDATGLKTVLQFNGVKTRDVDGQKKSYVSMKPVWEKDKSEENKTLTAYKPYLVEMDEATLKVSTENVTLKAAPEAKDIGDEIDGWVFKGTTKGYQWVEGDKEYDADKNIQEYAYGFAAEDAGSITAGQFVKAGNKAWIGPFRAFLFDVVYIGADAGISTVRSSVGNARPTYKLPEEMDVVIEDEDEQQTTTIGRLNTRTGEFLKAETRVFDLKGRNINGSAPRARGAYYGKKSVVR